MSAPKFRKKPVVIEAERLTWDNWSAVCELVGVPENGHGLEENIPEMTMVIHTLEGDMIAREGDYIIKGIKGECYPCKPDIFEATYEPA